MSGNSGTVRTTQRRLRAADDHDHTPTALSDALPRLATALDEAAEHAGWGAPPTLVRITAWPSKPLRDGFDLGVRPLEPELNVVEALAGFTAPPEWLAIGVVTEGNARHLVDPGDEPRRVRCVHLVDRSGASASTLRLQGEEASVLTGADHDPRGRVDDACRRALGLTTRPPEHSSIELWALVWLDRVLARAAADAGTRLQWHEVAELHPAIAVLVGDDERWRDRAAEHLTRLGSLLAQVHDWAVLRGACAAGEWPVDDISPLVAEWLDDGSFSRWVTGGFLPIGQLVAAVVELVPPSVARRVRAAIRVWRLPV
jgi:hypothetical protein